METTSILIGLILLAVSLFFISMPFRKKQQKNVKNSKINMQKEDAREMVISALRDLDFDFKTGKVSEEDYTPLRARLMAEAAQYIEQQQEEDQKLEALIQMRRTAHQSGVKCDYCGARVEDDQHFCAKCGKPVKNESCPACGKKVRAGEQFCPSCGNRLEVRMEAAVQS